MPVLTSVQSHTLMVDLTLLGIIFIVGQWVNNKILLRSHHCRIIRSLRITGSWRRNALSTMGSIETVQGAGVEWSLIFTFSPYIIFFIAGGTWSSLSTHSLVSQQFIYCVTCLQSICVFLLFRVYHNNRQHHIHSNNNMLVCRVLGAQHYSHGSGSHRSLILQPHSLTELHIPLTTSLSTPISH